MPPQVTYGMTEREGEWVTVLDQLNDLAQRWYTEAPSDRGHQADVETLKKTTVLLEGDFEQALVLAIAHHVGPKPLQVGVHHLGIK